jgi:hypothetical protein
VGPIGNYQLRTNVDASFLERFDFCHQRAGVDYDAVSDDGFDAGTEDSARDQLQNELRFANIDGVSSVVPSLVAHYHIEAFTEEIDDFAFAFIAPLGTEHD